MKNCEKCGRELADDALYCDGCGAAQEVRAGRRTMMDAEDAGRTKHRQGHEMTKDDLPDKYRPLGAWAYFGYSLLFAIPLVGLIVMIVLSCGGAYNVNLKNYARSFFCWLAIWAIVAVVLIVTGFSFANLALLFKRAF